jgi:hypothetical protein
VERSIYTALRAKLKREVEAQAKTNRVAIWPQGSIPVKMGNRIMVVSVQEQIRAWPELMKDLGLVHDSKMQVWTIPGKGYREEELLRI